MQQIKETLNNNERKHSKTTEKAIKKNKTSEKLRCNELSRLGSALEKHIKTTKQTIYKQM